MRYNVHFDHNMFYSFKAIRRLTKDDVKLMKRICQILNKVFCTGSEMQKMMERLNDFKKLATKEEEFLKEYQGIFIFWILCNLTTCFINFFHQFTFCSIISTIGEISNFVKMLNVKINVEIWIHITDMIIQEQFFYHRWKEYFTRKRCFQRYVKN